jgi:hypothetical protein
MSWNMVKRSYLLKIDKEFGKVERAYGPFSEEEAQTELEWVRDFERRHLREMTETHYFSVITLGAIF